LKYLWNTKQVTPTSTLDTVAKFTVYSTRDRMQLATLTATHNHHWCLINDKRQDVCTYVRLIPDNGSQRHRNAVHLLTLHSKITPATIERHSDDGDRFAVDVLSERHNNHGNKERYCVSVHIASSLSGRQPQRLIGN